MHLQSLEARAIDVLLAMSAQPGPKAASGRYFRSTDRQPGVRFWATTQQRYGRDLVGVQFHGRGRDRGESLALLLQKSGFEQRTPQKSLLTFAKPIDYARDGGIDVDAVARVRREIEQLLNATPDTAQVIPGQTFRDFMLASPLAEIDVPETQRAAVWRDGAV